METKVEKNTKKSEAQLKVKASPDELAPFIREAKKKLAKNIEIKGFRPGKAPLDKVEEVLGKEKVMNEALERAIPHFFVQAVMDYEVEAIARPAVTVEKFDEAEGLEFTATVAILPEVTFKDLSSIEIEKRDVTVSDEELDRELQHIAKTRSKFIDVARPAEKGDTVTVDFEIFMNGQLMEGGDSKNHPVHIGEGHFIPDFENKLQGVQAGEERQFEMHFPEDFAKEDLRGKRAEARVKVHSVQKRVLPEMNDEFAKSLGDFSDFNDLRTKLRENISMDKERREQDRRQSELSRKLAEQAQFSKIPDALVDKEIDRMLEELHEMLQVQQKNLEEYMAQTGKQMADLREEMRGRALEAVKVGLAVRAFTDKENIEIDESAVEKDVQAYLSRFKSPEEAAKHVDAEDLKERVGHMLKNQKALEKLESMVKVKQVKDGNAQTDKSEKE